MLAALLLLPIRPAALPAGPQDPPARGFELHGSFGLRVRSRWSEHASDSDLTGVVALDLGDAARDPVTASISAEAQLDLDGVERGSNSDAFLEIEDTYGDALSAHLYHAFVDVHSADGWEVLRAGRQANTDTPLVAWFDGARAETRELGPGRLRFGAYGGVPVQFDSGVPEGDALYGGFTEARPWSGGRVRADWMHAEEDPRLGQSNDLFAVGLWQRLWSNLHVDGQYSRIEERDRDLRLRASWADPDSDLVLRANWYRLLETQGDLAQPFDPFYSVLYELQPYQQFGLQASKSLTSKLHLQLGYDARRMQDDANESAFNHDFDRTWGTLGLTGLLPWQLEASLTGEIWDSPQSDLRTLGAELARHFAETLEAAAGTYYSLYEYDLYQARELDHVRVWYLRLVHDRHGPVRLELRYEFEEDPIDRYHDLRLGALWQF